MEAKPGPSDCTYSPMLALTAVLPSPETSHATPMRGDTLLQFGTLRISSNVRAGTKRPASTDCAGIDELK
ncbi:hypothetical protein D3C83_98620 [compost metagenome]